MKTIFKIVVSTAVILFSISLLSLSANSGGSIDVSLTSHFDNENSSISSNHESAYGSRVAFDSSVAEMSGYHFSHWILNGNVRKDLPFNHNFVIRNSMNLKAVFVPDNEHVVSFMDVNGQLLDIQYVAPGTDVLFEGEYPDKPKYVLANDPWGGDSLNNIQENKIFVAEYVRDTSESYNLSVKKDPDNPAQDYSFTYNETVTVKIEEANPLYNYFAYWELDGEIVSFDQSFSFTMLKNTNIEAKFLNPEVEETPKIRLSDNLELRQGYSTHLAQFYLPDGYELIEYGMISTSVPFDDVTLDTQGINRYQGEVYQESSNEFMMSLNEQSTTNPRAYLVYETPEGTLETVYSDSRVDLVVERTYEDLEVEMRVTMKVPNPDTGEYISGFEGYSDDTFVFDTRDTDDLTDYTTIEIGSAGTGIENVNRIKIDGVFYSIDQFIDSGDVQ